MASPYSTFLLPSSTIVVSKAGRNESSAITGEEHVSRAVSERFPVEVRQIPGRGRGLVASRRIGGGEVVLRDSPLLAYVDHGAKERCCSFCFRLLSTPRKSKKKSGKAWRRSDTLPPGSFEAPVGVRCPGCNECYFCNASCQAAGAARWHTLRVCEALRHLAEAGAGLEDDEAKSDARFLIGCYDLVIPSATSSPHQLQAAAPASSTSPLATDVAPSAAPGGARPLDVLLQLDGGGDTPPVTPRVDALHAFVQMATSGWEVGEGSDHTPAGSIQLAVTKEGTAAFLARGDRNLFGLMDAFTPGKGRSVRAYALYPLAALLNHGCYPNVCRFDDVDRPGEGNTDMYVRAMCDVPPGGELCLSYFPVDWSLGVRRERLRDEYGFECACERCSLEEGWGESTGNSDSSSEWEEAEEGEGEEEEEEEEEEGEEGGDEKEGREEEQTGTEGTVGGGESGSGQREGGEREKAEEPGVGGRDGGGGVGDGQHGGQERVALEESDRRSPSAVRAGQAAAGLRAPAGREGEGERDGEGEDGGVGGGHEGGKGKQQEQEQEEEEEEEEGEGVDKGERGGGARRGDKGKGKEEEEEEVEEEEGAGGGVEERELEHAVWFLKYLCPVQGCGGTMAPLVPPEGRVREEKEEEERHSQGGGGPGAGGSGGETGGGRGDGDGDGARPVLSLEAPTGLMECNACGRLRTPDELVAQIQGQE
eukprot:jgi/Mesen1/2823/ME000172S01965